MGVTFRSCAVWRRVREAHRFCVLCRQTGSTQLINNGGTPLMYAAEKGQLAVMDVLIKAGPPSTFRARVTTLRSSVQLFADTTRQWID